jgi:hypothetical protein
MKTTSKIIGIAIILMMVAIVSVSALDDPKVPGFTNQYVEIKNDVSTTGQFFGHIRAATNVSSNEVVVIGPAGQKNVPVDPDGTFEVTNLVPGKYTVYLLDGNGGQFEQSSFTVNAGGVSHLDSEILGHAFSATDGGKQPDVIVITEATYGAQMLVFHPAVTHQETITDTQAWDETVIDVAAYDEQIAAVTHVVHHNAVTHVVHHDAVYSYSIVSGGSLYTGYCKETTGTYDFAIGSKHYRIGTGMGYDKKYFKTTVTAAYDETVIDTPAYDETVIDVPAHTVHHDAQTHTVHHPAQTHIITVIDVPAYTETVGSYATVTTQVQQVIDSGARSFFFDNAQNPGGIFGEGNVLLSQITDPAPGQVKKVHIEYTINGNPHVIDANEYDVITI